MTTLKISSFMPTAISMLANSRSTWTLWPQVSVFCAPWDRIIILVAIMIWVCHCDKCLQPSEDFG